MSDTTRRALVCAATLFMATLAFSEPLPATAYTVIPKEAQQIICMDYRQFAASPTALELKERVMPPKFGEFERALPRFGINPETDLETLAFASVRGRSGDMLVLGIAHGAFSIRKVMARFKTSGARGRKYRNTLLFRVGALDTAFVDDLTMIFGEPASVREALDARDGVIDNLNRNPQLTAEIAAVSNSPVWSVLDAVGTQNFVVSALGPVTKLREYDVVEKRLLGARYTVEFDQGVRVDLRIQASDALSATALSALLQAGMMYQRGIATPLEKRALDNVSVGTGPGGELRVQLRMGSSDLHSVVSSPIFSAVVK